MKKTLNNEGSEDQLERPQRTKSNHPYVSSEKSLYAEIIYAAFNGSGLASENPETLNDAKNSDEWPEWEKASMKELEQLRRMEAWEVVDLPEGRHPIGNRWVFLKKYSKTGELEKYKSPRDILKSREWTSSKLLLPLSGWRQFVSCYPSRSQLISIGKLRRWT